jgi:hypothetical protein
LGRDYLADSHVRAVVVVSPEPLGGKVLCVVDAADEVLVNPLPNSLFLSNHINPIWVINTELVPQISKLNDANLGQCDG